MTDDLATANGPVPRDVRRAIAILRRSLRDPPGMVELARRCGVPERTLRDHFRRFVGCPPLRFGLTLRLAAVRADLLSGRGSVTGAAVRFGFRHPGRFPAIYARQFGELPSATLARARASEPVARPAVSDGPVVAIVPSGAAHADRATLETVAADLAPSRWLGVVLADKWGASCSPERIVRETGARYLLHVAEGGGSAQPRCRLVDGESGRQLRSVAAPDRTGDGTRRALVRAIRRAEAARVRNLPLERLDARGLALRALPLIQASTPDSVRRALDLLERASDTGPDCALAHALAAWGHGQLVMYNASGDAAADRRRSRDLARRAAALEDGDPLTLAALGAVHMAHGTLDTAEVLLAEALAQHPDCAWTWGRSGWLNAYRGRHERALRHFRRALQCEAEGNRANLFAGIGSAHFGAGRYGDAARWIERAVTLRPDMAWCNRSLSVAYARLGEREQARHALDALRRYRPDLTVTEAVSAVPFPADFVERLGDGLASLGVPP